MKLISGNYPDLRPLTDRIKESVFGILGDFVENSRVLDLYAGSGSIGIEALSRGARQIVFIEKNSSVANLIRSNLEKTKCDPGKYIIIVSDVLKMLPRLAKQQFRFEVVFADPPFRVPNGERLLATLSQHELMARQGIFIYRHYKKEISPESEAGLVLMRTKTYGDSVVNFYEEAGNDADSNISGHV